MNKLHAFYTSKVWRDLAYTLKIQRGGKCERCGRTVVTPDDWAKLIGHHKVELNEGNVRDANIALDPEKIEVICLDCHNRTHSRFGYAKQEVTIVWGSPLSGKTTAVMQMMTPGDLILDIDALWCALSGLPMYQKPDSIKANIFTTRDAILDQIRTRHGQWPHAWIIGGYADKYELERDMGRLGADSVHCESTKEECLKRRVESGKPEAWDGYIEDWWRVYERGAT